MDLRQLEYFVAVTEQGSFSRAAATLNLAQPSVSRQIALLEEELGQRLLERTGRGVTPTPAGQALLAHARVMLDARHKPWRISRRCTRSRWGRVVVGMSNRVAMGLSVPLIREFRQRLPNALLSVVEGLSLSLRDGMIAGRIDLGLLFDPAPTPLLSYEPLMRERMVLVAPKGIPAASAGGTCRAGGLSAGVARHAQPDPQPGGRDSPAQKNQSGHHRRGRCSTAGTSIGSRRRRLLHLARKRPAAWRFFEGYRFCAHRPPCHVEPIGSGDASSPPTDPVEHRNNQAPAHTRLQNIRQMGKALANSMTALLREGWRCDAVA